MNIKPIRNDEDLRAAFKRLERVYQAQEGMPKADEMEILVMLIEAYEHLHFPIGVVDPVEAIKFRMDQQGLTQKDVEPYIGSKWPRLRSIEPQTSTEPANGEAATRRTAHPL